MTVPVTGGSRSVDEETLHEFHLGFFGFIFTCNFIPVYFSLPISPCPLSHAPSSLPLPPLPSPTPSRSLPFLLHSSLAHCPMVIWEASPGRHTYSTGSSCLTPRTHRSCTKVSQSPCMRAVSFSRVLGVPRSHSNPTAHAPKENPPEVLVLFTQG